MAKSLTTKYIKIKNLKVFLHIQHLTGIIGLAKWLASWNAGKVKHVVSSAVYNKHNKKFLKSYSSKTLVGRMAKQEEIFGIFKYLIRTCFIRLVKIL